MANRLDHFMYASADLDAAIAHFERVTGTAPARGGSHPGMGTRNALASLGADVYVELIAPDPAQAVKGTFAERFATFARPQIHAFIIRAKNLKQVQDVYRAQGYAVDHIAASRNTPDGKTLSWELLIPQPTPLGVYVPYFIDWLDAPHPAANSPKGCTLERFHAGHPEAEKVGALWRALDIDLHVERSDAPYFHAHIATPKGKLTLTSGG